LSLFRPDKNVESDAAITTGRFSSDSRSDIFLLGDKKLTGYLASNSGRKFTTSSLFTFDVNDHVDRDYRNFQIKIHDVDDDGLRDVVLLYGKQNGLRWMKQLPKNKLTGPKVLVNVKAPTAFDINNMNGDKIADIIVYSSSDKKIYQSLAVIEV
jgi:hypothetical protein